MANLHSRVSFIDCVTFLAMKFNCAFVIFFTAFVDQMLHPLHLQPIATKKHRLLLPILPTVHETPCKALKNLTRPWRNSAEARRHFGIFCHYLQFICTNKMHREPNLDSTHRSFNQRLGIPSPRSCVQGLMYLMQCFLLWRSFATCQTKAYPLLETCSWVDSQVWGICRFSPAPLYSFQNCTKLQRLLPYDSTMLQGQSSFLNHCLYICSNSKIPLRIKKTDYPHGLEMTAWTGQ